MEIFLPANGKKCSTLEIGILLQIVALPTITIHGVSIPWVADLVKVKLLIVVVVAGGSSGLLDTLVYRMFGYCCKFVCFGIYVKPMLAVRADDVAEKST